MQRIPVVLSVLAVGVLASCSRGPKVSTPTPNEHPLAPYVAQRLAVVPAGSARPDSLGWVQQLGGARAVARRLDSLMLTALTDRALGARWVLPAELSRSYERNRSYAADPYQLALEPLRASTFVAGSRFGEPLSTQLRTMIALHDDVRYVLVPIDLRFERDVSGAGRGILRAALLDPRFAEARWVGELSGDTTRVASRALVLVAARLADLFTAP